MSLTGNDIAAALRAAGSSTSGKVASLDKIADLFNDAMAVTDEICAMFNETEDVAALVSECMMESAYFATTTEYTAGSNSYSPYDGRTFIQLTWQSNYSGFGKWAKSQGLVSDANYFVNNPHQLSDLKWAALGGVYYFTQVMFHGKPLTDYSHNIDQVGKAVNLGDPYSSSTPNGQKAREDAYKAVMAQGSRIIPACVGGATASTDDDEEDDDMAKAEHVKMHRTTNQAIKTADKDDFQWLYLDEDEHTSVSTVPAKIVGLVFLQVSGLNPSDSIYLRAGSYDVKKKDSGNEWKAITENQPDREQGNSSGWLSKSFPVVWDLGDQASGWDYRCLRFMVSSNTNKAVIENCRFEGYVTKK